MERLIDGFRRFRETYYEENREVFDALATQGQSPKAMVIACSDSRVDPQMIFGAGPGEIFVVRNVANLVPPYAPNADYHGTSAALEFAVRTLKVEHIIVLGHAQCGGINALMHAPVAADSDFIAAWMSIANAARDRAIDAGGSPDAMQRTCEHEAMKVSLDNLMTFPWIRAAVERRALRLHAWYFDLENGTLMRLERGGTFGPV